MGEIKMSEILKEKVGYIIFSYLTSNSEFYIRTSFNPALCSVKPGYFFDLDTGRFVPKSLVNGVEMTVQLEEPVHLKQQSDFWKSILLEV
jgi:hypothetical protein